MFDALVKRWIARQQRADRRAALTATVLANIHRKPNSRPFSLEDFLPHQWGAAANHRPAGHVQTQTPEQQIALLQAMTQGWGGTQERTDQER